MMARALSTWPTYSTAARRAPCRLQIVDHALAKLLFPVALGLEPRIELADRFVSEREEI